MIFDLWDTLVDFDVQRAREARDRIADRLGRDRDEFEHEWNALRPRMGVEPLAPCLRDLGIDDELVPEFVALRVEATRPLLVPRPGAVETLVELRRRGTALGMVSVCSEDVELLWPETPFAGLFDSEVFSCSAGLRKPDPRIYRLCLDELGVEPGEALFVGDGANDELGGAERAGLRPVLIHRAGQEPVWPEVQAWQGLRVTSIPEVLNLC